MTHLAEGQLDVQKRNPAGAVDEWGGGMVKEVVVVAEALLACCLYEVAGVAVEGAGAGPPAAWKLGREEGGGRLW